MDKKINTFKVGLFIIAAVILATASILVLGLGDALKENLECETYFNSSVQGASIGGPVLLRGVRVGQITDISLAGAAYPDGGQMILIRFTIDPKRLNPSGSIRAARQEIETSIQKGLRAKLAFAGVTGASLLELDYLAAGSPDRPIKPAWKPERLYIPSTPSLIAEVGHSLTRITQSLENVDFKGISQRADQTAQAFTNTLSRVDIALDEAAAAIREIRVAARGVSDLTREAGTLVRQASEAAGQLQKVRQLVADSVKTLETVNSFIRRLEFTLAAPQGDLPGILENLRLVSDNLREISAEAKEYPSRFLFGDKPPKVNHDQRR